MVRSRRARAAAHVRCVKMGRRSEENRITTWKTARMKNNHAQVGLTSATVASVGGTAPLARARSSRLGPPSRLHRWRLCWDENRRAAHEMRVVRPCAEFSSEFRAPWEKTLFGIPPRGEKPGKLSSK